MFKLDRRTLQKFLPNPESIRAFEHVLNSVSDDGLPSTIEEANALAGQSMALAQVALSMASMLAEALEALHGAPVAVPVTDPDDTAPHSHVGTLSAQNNDQVEITGGTIGGTAIGVTVAATGRFTTVESTVPTGTPPLIVASTDKVVNLYADRATLADVATSLGVPATYPTNATDLPTAIALVNAIKAANIAKGV